MEVVKKQSQSLEDEKISEKKALEGEVTSLREKLKNLESELEAKTKDVKTAEVNAVALRRQSDSLLLEYDRILEENQNLKNHLQSLDWRLSHSDSKKNS